MQEPVVQDSVLQAGKGQIVDACSLLWWGVSSTLIIGWVVSSTDCYAGCSMPDNWERGTATERRVVASASDQDHGQRPSRPLATIRAEAAARMPVLQVARNVSAALRSAGVCRLFGGPGNTAETSAFRPSCLDSERSCTLTFPVRT